MDDHQENHLRLLTLCKKMGDMWSETYITNLNDAITEQHSQASQAILYSKLFSRPNGLYLFTFSSAEDKHRVLDSGPWSFASNLLVLKEGEPTISEHYYDFTEFAFWVHLTGFPRVAISETAIRQIAGKLGDVEEVKTKAKTNNMCKVSKARVKLNLMKPLKMGTIIALGESLHKESVQLNEKALVIYNPVASKQISNEDTLDYSNPNMGKRGQQPQKFTQIPTMKQKYIDSTKKGKAVMKSPAPKKQKRFAPYDIKGSIGPTFEEQLLDTPIQLWEGEHTRALVASPNKPPL
ncbi:hypothetical protein BT93_H1835 [Corymbia citriodora subsp. variegata]|nr:hypothetical protein BT93_H1835 [Corymbia citriodora subsp. variegata]